MKEGTDIFTHDEAKSHARFHATSISTLLVWLIKDKVLGQPPLYDFGCGDGWYLSQVQKEFPGMVCRGFEGTSDLKGIAVHPNILTGVDVGVETVCVPEGNVICLEVGEHLPKEKHQGLLANLKGACRQGGYLVVSWARRGQAGRRHISCLDFHEVVRLFAGSQFTLDLNLTVMWREYIQRNEEERLKYFVNSIYIFRRN